MFKRLTSKASALTRTASLPAVSVHDTTSPSRSGSKAGVDHEVSTRAGTKESAKPSTTDLLQDARRGSKTSERTKSKTVTIAGFDGLPGIESERNKSKSSTVPVLPLRSGSKASLLTMTDGGNVPMRKDTRSNTFAPGNNAFAARGASKQSTVSTGSKLSEKDLQNQIIEEKLEAARIREEEYEREREAKLWAREQRIKEVNKERKDALEEAMAEHKRRIAKQRAQGLIDTVEQMLDEEPMLKQALDAMVKDCLSYDVGWDQLFKKFDLDGNGTLSKGELSIGLRQLGVTLGPLQLAGLMNVFDADGNDSIEYDEFVELLDSRKAVLKKEADEQKRGKDLIGGFCVGDEVDITLELSDGRGVEGAKLGVVVGLGQWKGTLLIERNRGIPMHLKPRHLVRRTEKKDPRVARKLANMTRGKTVG